MKVQDSLKLSQTITFKNRLIKSAMSEQMGDRENNPSKKIGRLYETWAEGGIAANISGNIMIDRQHLGEAKNIVIDEKSDLKKFKSWTFMAKKNNTLFFAQLNHPGKQTPAFLTKIPVAPSKIALGSGLDKVFNIPRELRENEILEIIQKFATAAKLCRESGFDGVQIHGAHGYLVNQFLSPLHNQRTDSWGGSLENRMRFVLEIYREIKKQTDQNYPIGIKLNSNDFQKGGFSEEDSSRVIKILSNEGIHFIEISGGNYENPKMMEGNLKESTKKREAYFLDYAKKIRNLANCPLMVTGGFRSKKAMNQALAENALDLIGLARPLALETDFPNKLLNTEDYSLPFSEPTTGNRSIDRFSMLGITWYEAQLQVIAHGKKPNKNLSPWKTIFSLLASMGINAFRKRRA